MSVEPDRQISVVIPTYNRAKFLPRAIRTSLEQSLAPLEVIVVDDGSDIDIKSSLEGFADRVRYVRLPENAGANAARNAGIAAAAGEWIAFLDDDDQWYPAKLALQHPLLLRGYAAALCGWHYEGKESQIQPVTEVTADMLRYANPFCGTSGLIARRDVLLQEPFDETLRRSQDWDMYVRLAQRGPLGYARACLFCRPLSTHPGITQTALDASPADVLAGARAVRKHRAWLGERHYRTLLATKILTGLPQKKQRHRFLVLSLREAGLVSTLAALTHLLQVKRRRQRID